MMANMASGAKDAVTENLQRTTTGGAIAAHIEAKSTAAAAEVESGGNSRKTGQGSTTEADASSPDNSDSSSGDIFTDGGAIYGGDSMPHYDPSTIGLPDDK